jgi:hypothetical protein
MKTEPTHTIRLYLSGPIETAKQIIREYAKSNPICVTIDLTTFIYVGGEEVGYVVGLLNYPRFPTTPEKLLDQAIDLAMLLRDRTFQSSALIVTKHQTYWISDRP